MKIPKSWNDISFEQYNRLTENKEVLEAINNETLRTATLLSLLTDYKRSEFLTLTVDEFEEIVTTVSFLTEDPIKTRKEKYIIDDEEYFLKEKLDLSTVGEQISFEICVQNLKDEKTAAIYAVALCLRKDLTAPFDPDLYNEMIEKVRKLPIDDFMYISAFFLLGVMEYTQHFTSSSKVQESIVKVDLLEEEDKLIITNGSES
jgi:hypothetical protein